MPLLPSTLGSNMTIHSVLHKNLWGGRPPLQGHPIIQAKRICWKNWEFSTQIFPQSSLQGPCGKTRVEHIFFKGCLGELGGKIWAETLRPSSELSVGWPGSLLPVDFRNFGPLAVFTLHAFTCSTTFAIFTVVLFLPFYGSTLLGACSRLSTYRRHPHLNSVECGGPSLELWCMSRPWWPPFTFLRSCASGSVFKALNLITQLLSQPHSPIGLRNPKPQVVSMKLPPTPCFGKHKP